MNKGLLEFLEFARDVKASPVILVPKAEIDVSCGEFGREMRRISEMAGVRNDNLGFLCRWKRSYLGYFQEERVEKGIVLFYPGDASLRFEKWVKLHSLRYSASYSAENSSKIMEALEVF